MIYVLCHWAEENNEHIAAPCQLAIAPSGGGTVTITWFNPVAYTSIEVWHVNLIGGPSHLETTLAGNATSWTTPILAAGDYFLIRGIAGDDHSGWSYSGPCV